jgi:hypothetical protein
MILKESEEWNQGKRASNFLLRHSDDLSIPIPELVLLLSAPVNNSGWVTVLFVTYSPSCTRQSEQLSNF